MASFPFWGMIDRRGKGVKCTSVAQQFFKGEGGKYVIAGEPGVSCSLIKQRVRA